MADGTIREYKGEIDWESIRVENFAMLDKQYEDRLKATELKVDKVKKHVETLKTKEEYKGCRIGLVFTKLEETLNENGSFTIYIDKGGINYIGHKTLNIADIE